MSTTPEKRPPAKRILLVEDDPAVCYFLGRVLHRAGYVVGSAEDGVAALHLFRAQRWDLVITDRKMPSMDGETLAREIRKVIPTQPIVLISGFPTRIEDPELFNAVFGKPFAVGKLLACLSALLRSPIARL